MQTKKRPFAGLMAAILACALMAAFAAGPVYADTDGTELQVAQAQKLEIQLGVQWAGVEFQLKTDTGLYPEPIAVGEDGVLRTEIGGSTTYILSCLNSPVLIPDPDLASDPDPAAADPDPAALASEPSAGTAELPADQSGPGAPADPEASGPDEVSGIPITHIVLFGGGMLLAIGALIVMRVAKKRKAGYGAQSYDDDDDE
jgi:hypothetical protein